MVFVAAILCNRCVKWANVFFLLAPLAKFPLCPVAHNFYDDVRDFALFLALGKIYQYRNSIDQMFTIETGKFDLVSSLRYPVKRFTDVSFIMVAYGQNACWATG